MFLLSADDSADFLDYLTFRNEQVLATVIIQTFLFLAGCVIIVGVVYVALLIFVIFCHHICFDRDPYKVPDFIRNSPQFHNDSGSSTVSTPQSRESVKDFRLESRSIAAAGSPDEERGHVRGPSAQKKAQIMDQFVTDLDAVRKKIQQKE